MEPWKLIKEEPEVIFEPVEWEGWNSYCDHPLDIAQRTAHQLACGKLPISKVNSADCSEGCGCFWDPSAEHYWKKHIDPITFLPRYDPDYKNG